MISRLLLCVTLLSIASSLFAHDELYPACVSNASDVDGDRYGWENNNTCIVDTSSIGPASFTNLETGLKVNLVRAYWNEIDFNKDLVCATFAFDGFEYSRIFDSIAGYQFSPRSLTPAAVGEVSVVHGFGAGARSATYPWTIDDGSYIGPGELERSRWIEIVNTASSTGSFRSLVRIWFLDQTYTQCLAVNPAESFLPTGSPPIAGECIDSDGDGWGWNGFASC